MGNVIVPSKPPEAILLQPAIDGDLDRVKELVGTFLASYSTSNQGHVDPTSNSKLHGFVNQSDPQGNSAIHGAVFAGHLNVVKYLVECCGASLALPNALGCCPIWLAAGYNRVDVLEYLLNKVYDPKGAILQANLSGDTALLAAVSRGNLEACQLLLHQAQRNEMVPELMEASNRNGDTPIIVAIAQEQTNEQLLKLLVDNSDDGLLNSPNRKGLTPLLVACERDNANLLQNLLDRHADITICDSSGASPLAVAAFCGSKQVLEVLLQPSFVDLLEQPNQHGCTPLWLAARSGRPEIVEMLLKAGADPSIENKDGVSPIGVARKYKREHVLELLNKNTS